MILDKEVLVFDYSKATNLSGYYLLANLQDSSLINIQFTWSGINNTNSYIKYAEKNDVTVLIWDNSKEKTITITTSNDSSIIELKDFSSKIIGIYLEKGNVTSGILRVRILSK